MSLPIEPFRQQFARFQGLIAKNDKGRAFTRFSEGIAAGWEAYKPRLRHEATARLEVDAWTTQDIGSGKILGQVITAIEIQDSRVNLTNNLVFWQNRYGHANRDHRALIEAITDAPLRRDLEGLLFRVYRGETLEESTTFERLRDLTGAKYPLLAYLFFLKDMDRFMPIQPTTFDRVFRDLGIDLVTLRSCSWDNYQRFNSELEGVRAALVSIAGQPDVRLIDAHSFCWLLGKLEDDSGQAAGYGRKDVGRILGSREKSIVAMRLSIEHTVKYSNGQIVERTVKNKDTNLNSVQIDELLVSLLDRQENRCALTGIPFHFHGPDADKNLLPSPDRIDSDGQYEAGNLQVVCQFVNSWKGDSDNEDFKRLLMLVRGVESAS